MTHFKSRQALLALSPMSIYILAVYSLTPFLGTGVLMLSVLPVLYISWSMGFLFSMLAWGIVLVLQSPAIMLYHHSSWPGLRHYYLQPDLILGNAITLLMAYLFAKARSLLQRLQAVGRRQSLISQLSQEALKDGSLSSLISVYLPLIIQTVPVSDGLAVVGDQGQKQMALLTVGSLPGLESSIILTAEEKQWLMASTLVELTHTTGSSPGQALLQKVGASSQGRVYFLPLKTGTSLYGIIMLFAPEPFTPDDKQFLKTLSTILSYGLEKQEHQQKLVHDYEQLLRLFDSLDALVYVVDPVSDELLFVNKKAAALIPPTEAHGPCYRLLYCQAGPCDFCTNHVLFGKNQNDTHHWEMHHPLTREWYHCSDQALQWADGRWVKFSVAVKITAIKEAQLKEQEQYHFLATLIEAIPGPVFYKNRKGVYLGCNQAFARFLDMEKPAIIGKSVFDFSPLELARAYDAADEALYRDGGPQIYEAPFRHGDGSLHTVVFHKALLTDSQGQTTGLIGVILDITKRKQLEAERLQNQKMSSIGQLAAGIAHEINTPIQFIGDNVKFINDAFVELLKFIDQCLKSPALPEEALESLKDLAASLDLEYLREEIPQAVVQTQEGVSRVSQIVRAMKAFAHPEVQESTMTNVNEVITNTVIVSKNEWKYVANLETRLEPDLLLVPALPVELGQVILNMIVNAAHAIEGKNRGQKDTKGLIQVITSSHDEYIEISIVDNGTGMPAEIQEKIFDPFFTTKPVGKGTGQGLAIAYTIIHEKHQGKIKVSSTPGQGTTFSIMLPLTAPSSSPEQALSSNTTA